MLNLNTFLAKKILSLLKINFSTSKFTTVFSQYTVYSAVEKLMEIVLDGLQGRVLDGLQGRVLQFTSLRSQ